MVLARSEKFCMWWYDSSVLCGAISIKLGTNIHRVE